MCISSWIVATAVVYIIIMVAVLALGLDYAFDVLNGPVGYIVALGLAYLPVVAFIDLYVNWPTAPQVAVEKQTRV